MTPLRREALLPNERGRGLGTVAVVCTMAGVASGLALATTLMAMQVADTMSTRPCAAYAYDLGMPLPQDQGFLGVTYQFDGASAKVVDVKANTPADQIGLRTGDRILAINGARLTVDDLEERIRSLPPGSVASLTVSHEGNLHTVRPVLARRPAVVFLR